VAEATRARARRPPRDGTRPPRRAVDRVVGGVGRGGCRSTEAARRAASAMARSKPRRDRIATRRRMRVAHHERRPSYRPGDAQRRIAEAALRPWAPVFTHGDLQVTHVFVEADEITGVIDWSEAGHGDALYDLATLKLGHEEHLGDVVAAYSTHVDLDVIRAWWSWRSLVAARWLIEHGFDPSSPGAEFDVLRSMM
jgi:aminoglycoside phosphotransferase (APT) family kinase protein